jgi:ketosteroid isomerase-like protein
MTSTDSKIQIVHEIYEAFGRSDVPGILKHLTDDVDWASDSQDRHASWHGPHHGKDQVPGFFAGLAAQVEVLEFTPLSVASNETDVLTVVRFRTRSHATGREATMHLHHWWRFRGDKVYFYRGSEDTAQTAAVLKG